MAAAKQPRQRDHNAIAVTEPTDPRDSTDEDLPARAPTENRTPIADNQRDSIPIPHRRVAEGPDPGPVRQAPFARLVHGGAEALTNYRAR